MALTIWITVLAPPENGAQGAARKWDERFESALLQRRVMSEPGRADARCTWRPCSQLQETNVHICGDLLGNRTEAEIGDFAVSADVAQRISMPNFTRRLATA
jgi:hypothetical protein